MNIDLGPPPAPLEYPNKKAYKSPLLSTPVTSFVTDYG